MERSPQGSCAPFAIEPKLTISDRLVLHALLRDVSSSQAVKTSFSQNCDKDESLSEAPDRGIMPTGGPSTTGISGIQSDSENGALVQLRALNDSTHADFLPSVFLSWDLRLNPAGSGVQQTMLRSYICWARTVVRHETDVVMLTQLLVYFTTSLPSAILLFWRFTLLHGLSHIVLQLYHAGSYTLMMHQHIHMRGILAKKYAWLDHIFPYITDPLMGHTWNSYYFHHIKHHHVENNGPADLSSTIQYQRDSRWDFVRYLARFVFLAWAELPWYFIRKGRPMTALKCSFFELGNYFLLYRSATTVSFRATLCVLLVPLLLMRVGLMIGNWGQHAFVDDIQPDSHYRSSITLIDVTSNRYCYNDGYHTSHHLNPRRHWREHPISFLEQKHIYARESALVFRDIDYFMMTMKLLRKDYLYLAKCLVPIGSQVDLSIEEIAALLATKTRRFTEREIDQKFRLARN